MCTSDLDIIRTLAAGHGEGVAVFVAHPDDEVIMSGGFLSSAPNTLVIHATDGAPRDEGHVQRRGFKSIEEYRGTRSIELEAVLRIAGITRHIGFDVPDLQGPFNLTHLATQLADACMENMICVIFTHAYEGGHPDHDACAFAAHAAVQLVKRAGHELHIAEAPVYRPSRDGKSNVRQRFLPDSNATIVETTLSPKQRAAKHRMFLAHKSQANVLKDFDTTTERWRLAHPDFSQVPLFGIGKLYGLAGLDEKRWLSLVQDACHELGVPPN